MPSVAMNGGMRVYAMRLPLTSPASAPVARPAAIGTTTGRSVSDGNTARAFAVCARLAAIIADSATTEPDDRSMPPVRITCVTPMASRPMIETCSTMTSRRCPLNRKLVPRTLQPDRLEEHGDADEHQEDPGVVRESPLRQWAASLISST